MNKLKWLINRLRQMSFSEVFFRLSRTILQRREKQKVLNGWQPLPQSKVFAKTAMFGTGPEVATKWACDHKLDFIRLDSYLDGQIDFFGHESLDIGMPVCWHTDPVTAITSPLEFGKTLDYRNDQKVGNVKFVWELGRHQHLVPLAVAYAITGDTKYRDAVVGQISSWINDNPYGMGIHWCSSLEVALRLISWSLIHSFIAIRDGDEGLFGAVPDSCRLGASIYQQSYFIRHYLSLYSSANNHLIGELTGLWTACQIFDLGDDGRLWSDFCFAEIEKQARLQVYEDGVNKEQAFYYHLWVLEYFVFSWLIANHIKKPFSQGFSRIIENMSAFIQSVSPENGVPPQVGDADDGFVARFDPFWPESPYEEMTAVIDLLSKKEVTFTTQKVFWYNAVKQEELPSMKLDSHWRREYPELYPKGGYCILGDRNTHIVFDGGALGYLGIAAHGHADALSFCLAIDGDWWLIDPGTYAYHSEKKWRDYFRGTSAHNTIKINDEDQSTISGAFMWSQKANAKIGHCKEGGDNQSITATHDGYKAGGVLHERELKFNKQQREILIRDVLDCTTEVKAEIFFHFPPEVSLEYDKNNDYWVAKHENSSAQLVFILDNLWKVKIVKGQQTPILGWYSPALEEKVPTNVLHGMATVCKNTVSVCKILIK